MSIKMHSISNEVIFMQHVFRRGTFPVHWPIIAKLKPAVTQFLALKHTTIMSSNQNEKENCSNKDKLYLGW